MTNNNHPRPVQPSPVHTQHGVELIIADSERRDRIDRKLGMKETIERLLYNEPWRRSIDTDDVSSLAFIT